MNTRRNKIISAVCGSTIIAVSFLWGAVPAGAEAPPERTFGVFNSNTLRDPGSIPLHLLGANYSERFDSEIPRQEIPEVSYQNFSFKKPAWDANDPGYDFFRAIYQIGDNPDDLFYVDYFAAGGTTESPTCNVSPAAQTKYHCEVSTTPLYDNISQARLIHSPEPV